MNIKIASVQDFLFFGNDTFFYIYMMNTFIIKITSKPNIEYLFFESQGVANIL